MILFASTILLSAFLLFLVQPIIAKQILPWFGGSAAVWTVCMVFFQALLLAGYAYAHWLSRRPRQKTQTTIHILLLLASLAVLPIIPAESWKPAQGADPLLRILGLLGAAIGLPYFLLSSTGPLIQKWFANAYPSRTVYRLFALSNFGSLVGLVSYPVLVEPWAGAHTQSWVWSGAYALFVGACSACAWRAGNLATGPQPAVQNTPEDTNTAPGARQIAFWLMCSALGSVMLLAVTSHITQNVSSIPFLWVLPLTLYLLSFVVCFEGRSGRGWYVRRVWLLPVLALTVGMGWGLSADRGVLHIHTAIPLYCAGLFFACVFFHGELAASKPAPAWLTQFYLSMSAGGALGGLLVALVAPHVFNAYYELPLTLLLLTLVSLWLLRGKRLVLVVCLCSIAGAGYYGWKYFDVMAKDTLLMTRNFYGTLRIKDSGSGTEEVRRLLHGVIMHGEQSLDPAQRRIAGTYYSAGSGIGLSLRFLRAPGAPLKVGLIGLGTGTLAAYGKAGDTYRIYELNPDVVQVANRWFSYLKDSPATIETVLGDARLSMEQELAAGAAQQYDVIAIDAFSSDSIPVHLITREALDVYARHLKADGVIAFHVSNRYLDLPPVVRGIADATGFEVLEVSDDPNENVGSSSTWVLVTRNRAFLAQPDIAAAGQPIAVQSGLRLWTDQFNNLFQILK